MQRGMARVKFSLKLLAIVPRVPYERGPSRLAMCSGSLRPDWRGPVLRFRVPPNEETMHV